MMTAVAAIDAYMRRMTRASAACRRLMTIPGVGQLTALAFVAAIDDPSRIRVDPETSAPISAWSPGGISLARPTTPVASRNAGDRRVRTLLYEAANVMPTRYKGQLKLKDVFAIAKRSTMCKARAEVGAPARDHQCTRCCGTEPSSHRHKPAQSTRQEAESSSGKELTSRREGADDGADFVAPGHL